MSDAQAYFKALHVESLRDHHAAPSRSMRIGAAEVDVSQPGRAEPVDYLKHGRPVHRLSDRVARYTLGRLQTVYPQFNTAGFMRTETDLQLSLDRREELLSHFMKSDIPEGIKQAHADVLQKSCLLSGHSGSGHIESEGLSNTRDNDMESWRYIFDWIYEHTVPAAVTDLKLSLPRGTSHGWPTYVGGKDGRNQVDLELHIWLAACLGSHRGDIAAAADEISKLGSVVDPLSALMFFRSGPIKKAQTMYALTPNGPVPSTVVKGVFPRARQVYAVPTWINTYLRKSATVLKLRLKQLPNFYFTSKQVTLDYMRRFSDFEWISEDLSAYDKSVTRAMQRSLLAQYRRHMTEDEARAYDQMIELPVLAPALDSTSGAFLYNQVGQTKSGTIYTSLDGTLINFARTADAVAAGFGVKVSKVMDLFERKWTAFWLGDDVVLGFQKAAGFSMSRYKAASDALGFTTTGYPGAIWLMEVFDPARNRAYHLESRTVDSTEHRERRIRSWAQVVLGVGTRWPMIAGAPGEAAAKAVFRDRPDVTAWIRDELKSAVTPADFANLLAYAADPLTLAACAKALNADADLRSTLADWFVSQGRGDSEDIPADMAYFASLLGGVSALREDLKWTDFSRSALSTFYKRNKAKYLPILRGSIGETISIH